MITCGSPRRARRRRPRPRVETRRTVRDYRRAATVRGLTPSDHFLARNIVESESVLGGSSIGCSVTAAVGAGIAARCSPDE